MTSKADDHAPDANAKPETAPKRKPWHKPDIRVIEVNFTQSGFDADPRNTESGTPPLCPTYQRPRL